MAKIKLFLNDTFIKDYDLSGLHEFYSGRSPDCLVPLEVEKGISRKHLKFFLENEKWTVECIAKSAEFYEENLRVVKSVLREGVKFRVPPYSFEFEDHQIVSVVSQVLEESPSDDQDFGDRTMVVNAKGVPFLKVLDSENDEHQIFQLEGHHWIVGRDSACSVYVNYSQMSRRQFEIKFQEGSFLVNDCDSSNGTILNGVKLTQEPQVLNSGDIIKVADWQFHFELRDPYFAEQVKVLNPPKFDSRFDAVEPQAISFDGFDAPVSPVKKPKNKILVRSLMGLFAFGILGVVVYDELKPVREPATVAVSKATPFQKLKPEQQMQVQESYKLAEQLYREGKWELARQELLKIHSLIPSYEQSDDLLKLVDQAYTMQQEMKILEQQEKDRAEREKTIAKQVAICERKLPLFQKVEDLEACFAPVIDLDPDNARLVQMRMVIEEKLTQAKISKEKKAQYQNLVNQQAKLFADTQSEAKKTDRLSAIKVYEKFLKGTLPDPQNYRVQVRNLIKDLRDSIAKDQKRFNDEGEEAIKAGDFKTAAAAFVKAVEINPDDEVTKSRREFALNELRKQMQSIFHEAILEESVGEVDSAKEKYKKIRSSSVPEEEYFKKSTIKLKRFGVL